MARWGVVVGLGIAAFVALAIATEDMCSGLTPSRLVSFAVIAVFFAVVTEMSLQRPFSGRPWMPWMWAVAVGTTAFMLLLVSFIAYFGAECSR